MCNIIRLHSMFKQGSNKYDSQVYQDFPPEYIDDFFYDAELDYVRHCVTTQPIAGILKGFQTNQQRMDMIRPYLNDYSSSPAYNKTRGKQTVTVFKLPKNYYLLTEDVYSFDDCGNSIKVDVVEYQNLDSYINTPKKLQAQLLWSQAYATLKGNELHVFYPERIKTLEASYVIMPKRVFSGGYNSLETIIGEAGYTENSSRVDPLVPDAYCNILVDIAIANVFGNLRDYNLAQFKKQNLTI